MSDKNLFDNSQNAIWIFTVTGGSAAKVEGTFTLGSYKDQVKIHRSSKLIPSATLVDDGDGQLATPIEPIILKIVEDGAKLANIMAILTGNPSMYDSAKIISGHKADNNLVVDYEIDLKNVVLKAVEGSNNQVAVHFLYGDASTSQPDPKGTGLNSGNTSIRITCTERPAGLASTTT